MGASDRRYGKGFQDRLAAQAAARKKNIARLSSQTEVRGSRHNGSGQDAAIDGRQSSGLPAEPPRAQFRVVPKIADNVVLHSQDGESEIPSIVKILLSAIVQTDDRAPLCVLLPSTEYIPELLGVMAGLECLRADFPEAANQFIDIIHPGARLRALPEGYVFVAGQRAECMGIRGMYVHYTEKDSWETNGRRFVPDDQLLRYEPTRRRLPISRASIKLAKPILSGVDKLAGTRTLGNTALYRTRIVLVGSRAEFERAMGAIELRPAKGGHSTFGPLSDHMAWGCFQPSGDAIIVHPSAANGSPLVSISPDIMSLEKPCLDRGSAAGSQFIITSRLDQVLNSLDLTNRLGERQRFVLLAESRRRGDLAPLRKHGWRIWEPQPFEIAPSSIDKLKRTAVPGIDRTLGSARTEADHSIGFMQVESGSLEAAYRDLADVGEHLSTESAVFDEKIQQALDTADRVFFRAAGLLGTESLDAADYSSCMDELDRAEPYIARYLGADAAAAVGRFRSAIEKFISESQGKSVTAKGVALLNLARNAEKNSGFGQAFVAGNRYGREQADNLFAAAGLTVRCKQVAELIDLDAAPSIVAFSLIRRDLFGKLMDPWPSKNIIFAGYEFELDIYKRRLRMRDVQKQNLRLDEADRSRIACRPSEYFGKPRTSEPRSPETQSDPLLSAFDMVTDGSSWDWSRRMYIPAPPKDEEAEPAHVIRFVGRSWMPMSVDHHALCLHPIVSGKSRSGLEDIEVAELKPGIRVLVREGGERDVVRALAERICGAQRYEQLQTVAHLWQRALQRANLDAPAIAARLAELGVERHVGTVRGWLKSTNLIGPRSDEDVKAIAEAFPIPGMLAKDWSTCCDSISELRSLHMSAGMQLTDDLFRRCGTLLLEPSDTEIAVEFELGLVWVLTVAETQPELQKCPSFIVNRLQWMDTRWRDEMLSQAVRAEGT
jgi:hypothetical protein